MAEKALMVANTTNVKEMKNGRPMNVRIAAGDLPNCTIIKLGARETGENDHVYAAEVIDSIGENELEHGLIYVVVAPEIMVEEARLTDGHIGKFRFEKGGVYTAYQLSKHDRLELSEGHPSIELGTTISDRPMATGAIIKPAVLNADGKTVKEAMSLYDGAQLKMVKVEF